MSVTIISTIGSASANSYITLAEAASYFSNRSGTAAWDAATDDERSKAIITACARLEEDDYLGWRCTTTQALRWPRYNVEKIDFGYGGYPSYYLSTEIPQQLKDAQCELAQEVLTSDAVQTGEANVPKSVKIGGIQVEFTEGTAGTISARVAKLLTGLRVGGGARMVRA